MRLKQLTGFLLNTMIAAGAMSLSSGFVLTNSLRLRRFKADGKDWATATMNEAVPYRQASDKKPHRTRRLK